MQDITSSIYDLKLPCLCHHSHYIWHLVHCICVITSTVLFISHQMYFWDHIRYSSQHHIHCIRHDTQCMTSQPLFHGIRFPTYHIICSIYDMSSPIAVTSQTLCLWIYVNIFNIKHMVLRQYTNIYIFTTSVCVSGDQTHSNDGITHIVFMTWELRYLWKYMHCIWHLPHDLWHLNTLSNSSVYYISYQTEYIWQHIHCISVFTPRLSII